MYDRGHCFTCANASVSNKLQETSFTSTLMSEFLHRAATTIPAELCAIGAKASSACSSAIENLPLDVQKEIHLTGSQRDTSDPHVVMYAVEVCSRLVGESLSKACQKSNSKTDTFSIDDVYEQFLKELDSNVDKYMCMYGACKVSTPSTNSPANSKCSTTSKCKYQIPFYYNIASCLPDVVVSLQELPPQPAYKKLCRHSQKYREKLEDLCEETWTMFYTALLYQRCPLIAPNSNGKLEEKMICIQLSEYQNKSARLDSGVEITLADVLSLEFWCQLLTTIDVFYKQISIESPVAQLAKKLPSFLCKPRSVLDSESQDKLILETDLVWTIYNELIRFPYPAVDVAGTTECAGNGLAVGITPASKCFENRFNNSYLSGCNILKDEVARKVDLCSPNNSQPCLSVLERKLALLAQQAGVQTNGGDGVGSESVSCYSPESTTNPFVNLMFVGIGAFPSVCRGDSCAIDGVKSESPVVGYKCVGNTLLEGCLLDTNHSRVTVGCQYIALSDIILETPLEKCSSMSQRKNLFYMSIAPPSVEPLPLTHMTGAHSSRTWISFPDGMSSSHVFQSRMEYIRRHRTLFGYCSKYCTLQNDFYCEQDNSDISGQYAKWMDSMPWCECIRCQIENLYGAVCEQFKSDTSLHNETNQSNPIWYLSDYVLPILVNSHTDRLDELDRTCSVFEEILQLCYSHMQAGRYATNCIDVACAYALPLLASLIVYYQRHRELYQHESLMRILINVYHAAGASLLEYGYWEQAHQVWMHVRQVLWTDKKCEVWKDTLLYKQTEKDLLYRNVLTTNALSPSSCKENIDVELSHFHEIAVNRKPVVYISAAPILTREQCQHIIQSAEEHAVLTSDGLWTTARHYDVPTTDFPMHAIPSVAKWFSNDIVNALVKPILRKHFITYEGISPATRNTAQNSSMQADVREGGCKACDDIIIHDVFVVKYCAPTGVDNAVSKQKQIQKSLPLHFDQSTHSFVIALNDCTGFSGGGTYIPDLLQQSRVDGGQGVVRIGR